jgi:hypothetical protein
VLGGVADPFVVATACIHKSVVVSEETAGTDGRPKIPTVCCARSIQCIKLLKLIQNESWRFG